MRTLILVATGHGATQRAVRAMQSLADQGRRALLVTGERSHADIAAFLPDADIWAGDDLHTNGVPETNMIGALAGILSCYQPEVPLVYLGPLPRPGDAMSPTESMDPFVKAIEGRDAVIVTQLPREERGVVSFWMRSLQTDHVVRFSTADAENP